MEKKSVSASLLIIYLAAFFAVIGSCFYEFVFKENQIKVEKVLVDAVGILVFNDKDLKEKSTALNLSNMETGIRPATGKIDKDTQIPSTISAESTSEGYYAKVYVDKGVDFKIIVSEINIISDKHELDLYEERKNIFISIENVQNSTKSLEEDDFLLAEFKNVNEIKELTFFVWLGAFADDVLKGSKINFKLNFISI